MLPRAIYSINVELNLPPALPHSPIHLANLIPFFSLNCLPSVGLDSSDDINFPVACHLFSSQAVCGTLEKLAQHSDFQGHYRLSVQEQ